MTGMSAAQRVTQRTLNRQVSTNLQRNLVAMGRLQEQLSSGRLISKPSDSPTGTVSALRLRAEVRRGEQYQRNADDGIGWLGTADNTLTEALSVVRRVRELTLQAANASVGETGRTALAAEVTQLHEHLLSLANTSYLGQPIFGGTADVTEAFSSTGSFLGDGGAIERTVGKGMAVQVNLGGEAVFGADGDNLFGVVTDIADHMRNDPAALSATDLAKLDEAFLRVQDSLALVGARFNQVEAMSSRAANAALDAKTRLAEVESIDLPQTIMELQLQEVAYQAALGAAARVLQPSLVDFLR